MNKSTTSWIDIDKESDFPIQNIPFGVVKLPDNSTTCATRIGDTVIDLAVLHKLGYFDGIKGLPNGIFNETNLNAFIELGKPITNMVRISIQDIFKSSNIIAKEILTTHNSVLYSIQEVTPQLPINIRDYTDFYSSIDHATNVGKMFRDPENALLPNWKHLPVGYHGRASSIVPSGTSIYRPKGQVKSADANTPSFSPSKLMDFELEMAFITGKSTQLGESVSVENAEEYIFGMVIFNDLSARDIQAWEYVPLGPFLGKSFGSVISPWIITIEALAPFKTPLKKQEPEVLPYLRKDNNESFDLNLNVFIQPEKGSRNLVCQSNLKHLYWSMAQQLAHQTVNGCNINVGDIYASGTISGPTPGSFGSLLELTWRGSKPITLNDGAKRKFMNDNDTVIMLAYGEKDGLRIGFGECKTKILPAKS
jgi:fumarylacetoacetase